MTWNGRQLATATNGTNNVSYSYDENGIRTQKTVNGTVTNYNYHGSALISQVTGNDTLLFSYDAAGNVAAVNFNGTYYYYVRNGQNDIIRLIDGDNNPIVEYAYDSWGTLLSTTGTLASTLGAQNPFRYRGYVYDAETGLYYVTSRYYDPEIGRWINSDNMITTGSDLAGLNLFAYCGNNPVNRVDPSGRFWISAIIKTVVVVAATIAKVVYTVKETKRVQEELDTLPEPTADISESFRKTLRDNANTVKETTKNKGIIESGKQFYNKVRNKGEWDLKQLPEYQGTFRFNNLVIQGQDIGNINFGYTGKALGLPDSVLLAGAGFAQIKAGTSNFSFIMASNGDDLRDQIYIMYGIMLYNEDH